MTDDLRAELGRLVRELLEEGQEQNRRTDRGRPRLLHQGAVAQGAAGCRGRPDDGADADVTDVLDELLAETSALTRVLLGAGQPGVVAAPDPHGWMTGFGTIELS